MKTSKTARTKKELKPIVKLGNKNLNINSVTLLN